MEDEPIKTFTPDSRLTRMGNDMLRVFDQHKEFIAKDRAIVLMFDEEGHGAISMSGYTDDAEAITDLYFHLRALFKSNGQELHLIKAGVTPPEDRA